MMPAKHFPDQASQDRYYGRICGYPECCIEFYIDCQRNGRHPPQRSLIGKPRKIDHTGRLPAWICGKDKVSKPVFVPCPYHWTHPPKDFTRQTPETYEEQLNKAKTQPGKVIECGDFFVRYVRKGKTVAPQYQRIQYRQK